MFTSTVAPDFLAGDDASASVADKPLSPRGIYKPTRYWTSDILHNFAIFYLISFFHDDRKSFHKIIYESFKRIVSFLTLESFDPVLSRCEKRPKKWTKRKEIVPNREKC